MPNLISQSSNYFPLLLRVLYLIYSYLTSLYSSPHLHLSLLLQFYLTFLLGSLFRSFPLTSRPRWPLKSLQWSGSIPSPFLSLILSLSHSLFITLAHPLFLPTPTPHRVAMNETLALHFYFETVWWLVARMCKHDFFSLFYCILGI